MASKSISAAALAFASASMIFPSLARAAAEAAAPVAEKVELGPAPTDFGLTYFYFKDAEKVSLLDIPLAHVFDNQTYLCLACESDEICRPARER
jgi:hypothetical protein